MSSTKGCAEGEPIHPSNTRATQLRYSSLVSIKCNKRNTECCSIRPTYIFSGSFHAKSPKIRKISRVTISDFDENWLKCSSTYMMATCKKVLSSGNKFYFYSHIIYRGGSFLFHSHDVQFE